MSAYVKLQHTLEPLLARLPFSTEALLKLFLVCAFPINLWAIIITFKEIGSIAEEATWGDAIGVGAYLLVFALFESLLIFSVVVILSLFLPKKWEERKTVAQISTFYLLLAIGFILEQSRALVEFPTEGGLWQTINLINNLVSSRVVVLLLGVTILATLFYKLHRSEKVLSTVTDIIDKLVVLSSLYLVVDLISVIIVIIRNLSY